MQILTRLLQVRGAIYTLSMSSPLSCLFTAAVLTIRVIRSPLEVLLNWEFAELVGQKLRYRECKRLLLDAGADPTLDALYGAIREGDIVRSDMMCDYLKICSQLSGINRFTSEKSG